MKARVKKWSLVLAALLVVTAFLAGCTGTKETEGKDGGTTEQPSTSEENKGQEVTEDNEKKVIGISLFYRRDEYYKDLETAFIEEAEKAGFEIIIQDADTDPVKQTQQIEDFVQQKVDAIALAAADPVGLVPAIEAAVEAGIPVFTYDGPASTDKVVTHVGFDYYEDGKLVGEWTKKYIEENMGGKANVAIIDYPQSAIVCAQRAQGFRDVMETMPGVKVVAQQDGKASRTDSMAVMENILTAHPEVNVVYGINWDTCAGALAAIEAAGREDIIVVGNLWASEAFEMLEQNHPIYKAGAVSSPVVQARDTIAAIVDYFAGKEVPKETMSHSTVYDATNISELNWREIVAKRKQ